jgi:hypothetical protein
MLGVGLRCCIDSPVKKVSEPSDHDAAGVAERSNRSTADATPRYVEIKRFITDAAGERSKTRSHAKRHCEWMLAR